MSPESEREREKMKNLDLLDERKLKKENFEVIAVPTARGLLILWFRSSLGYYSDASACRVVRSDKWLGDGSFARCLHDETVSITFDGYISISKWI